MACHRLGTLALAVLLAGALPAWAGPPAAALGDAQKLADRIDELIAAQRDAAGVKPAELADDAMFLRRLWLDVVGRTPAVADSRAFLKDTAPDKRQRMIETLLDSAGYVNHMSNVWRHLMLPETDADFQRQFLAASLDPWLRKQFTENVPYDRMVRELVTMPFSNENRNDNPYAFYGRVGDGTISPMAYYLAKNGDAPEIASGISRLFLGIRIECARCHDHPFATWTREQFWGQASFFAGIRSPRGQNVFYGGTLTEVPDRRELPIPGTEKVAQAKFLDGGEPQWKFKVSARTTLADWMTAPDNPFFARTAVNRLWAQFFGIGLVDPIDDFTDENKPSHPELLDELARQFVAHGYDMKFIVRAIALSKTYQQSSVHPDKPDPRLFAHVSIKGLSFEQLIDSLVQATGMRGANTRRYGFNRGLRFQLGDKFAEQEKRTEYQTSIPQALTLMNSQLISGVTDPERSEVLGAVVNAPWMTTRSRVETLFLAALARKPTPEEAEKYIRYVEKGGAKGDEKKALSDVFWALLNSPEFILNH
jgi:hypothetical protein